MKLAVRNILLKAITFLTISVMALFIVNKAVFLHVHKLNDGTIIEHAHPYDKSADSKPFKSHHHSNVEFLLLQNVEFLFLLVFSALALIIFVKKDNVYFKYLSKSQLVYTHLYQGRAPPFS